MRDTFTTGKQGLSGVMKSNFIYARVAEREHGTKINSIEASITKDDAPLEQRWEDKVNPNPY